MTNQNKINSILDIMNELQDTAYKAVENMEIVLSALEHGMRVELDGELTRATESTNTLGFYYQGHTLFYKPGIVFSDIQRLESVTESLFSVEDHNS